MDFFNILLSALIQLGYLTGTAIAIGFVLGFMRRRSIIYMNTAFGDKAVMLSAIFGTPVHELGHAAMCLLFGHRIEKVKLVQLPDKDGTLGYVNHSYNSKSVYQRAGLFFIGLAPLFSGTAAIVGLMAAFLPDSFSSFIRSISTDGTAMYSLGNGYSVFMSLSESLFSVENFMRPAFWLFMFLAVSIASHIALSKADVSACKEGLAVIYICLVMINLAGNLIGQSLSSALGIISIYNSYLLSFSLVALMFSAIGLALSYFAYRLRLAFAR